VNFNLRECAREESGQENHQSNQQCDALKSSAPASVIFYCGFHFNL
jgi:hypothetical protein